MHSLLCFPNSGCSLLLPPVLQDGLCLLYSASCQVLCPSSEKLLHLAHLPPTARIVRGGSQEAEVGSFNRRKAFLNAQISTIIHLFNQ